MGFLGGFLALFSMSFGLFKKNSFFYWVFLGGFFWVGFFWSSLRVFLESDQNQKIFKNKIADPFIRKAREAYYIKKLQTLKRLDVNEIEHGLNVSPGQTH